MCVKTVFHGFCFLFVFSSVTVSAQIGIFDNSVDIGDVSEPGNAIVTDSGEYEIEASGEDIWGTADECHYAYTEMSGPFAITANCLVLSLDSSSNWMKAGLMIRNSLEPGAVNYFADVRTDFQVSSQWRANVDSDSGWSNELIPMDVQEGALRIVRVENNLQTFYYDVTEGKWVLSNTQTIELQDPVYVGLAVTAHEDGNFALGIFSDVELNSIESTIGSRTIAREIANAGETVDVSISLLTPDNSEIIPTIIDNIPSGFNAVNINNGGQVVDGAVVWNDIAVSNGPLTYQVVTPATSDTIWEDWSGTIGESAILGDRSLVEISPGAGDFGSAVDWVAVDGKAKGNVTYENGVYTLMGSGYDIWGSSDGGYFVFTNIQGSFVFEAQFTWIEPNPGSNARIGMMVRDPSWKANARNYYPSMRQGGLPFSTWRSTEGGASDYIVVQDSSGVDVNGFDGIWFRMTRTVLDGMIVAEYSLDGTDWFVYHELDMEFPNEIPVGFAIYSSLAQGILSPEDLVTAEVDNVSIEILDTAVCEFMLY